jgi:hypothetical protein
MARPLPPANRAAFSVVADDVWLAASHGALAFAHGRAAQAVATSLRDAASLIEACITGAPTEGEKRPLDRLKEQFETAREAVEPLIEAVKPEAERAADAVSQMATEIGTEPFTWEAAARATVELAEVVKALGRAIDEVAKAAAAQEPEGPGREQLRAAIANIKEPWIAPLRGVGADATRGFDSVCRAVLGMQNAGARLDSVLVWNKSEHKISAKLLQAGLPDLGPLQVDSVSVEPFFTFKDEAKLGIAVKGKLRAGLRSEGMMQKIIPGQAPTADSENTSITLDTKDGLTFGEGKDRRIVLPARFVFPGLELREFALTRPEKEDAPPGSGRVDVMVTIAGRMGDTIGAVAEGAGAIITWRGGDAPIEVKPRPPHAVGLRFDAGVVRGGGFLRHVEERDEYGGVLDLQFAKFGVTAFGLIGSNPFSLVIVMAVRFRPKIELGFGFTLDGLGGLLALERRLDSEALRRGLREGALNTLLFPENAMEAAPSILDRLGDIFPPQRGAFVVGPLFQLGWGSQAGFVRAKLGLVLALPDPRVVLLGSLEVAVPTVEAPRKLRFLDLHAEMFAEFAPDYFLVRVSLVQSKLSGIPVSGDMGLLLRWGGEASFAMSAGGFFPGYEAPPELADLRRFALELSPPLDWMKLRAEGYAAVTAGTVQFGGSVVLTAKVGPASGKAWLSLDALFQWAPRFRFHIVFDAGIEVKVFGETIAGVAFHGEVSGTTPWRLEGRASVTVIVEVPIDIGPIEWGEREPEPQQAVEPLAVAAQALNAPAAWTPQLPVGTEAMVRLAADDTTPLLVHPLGSLEVKQLQVPLEVEIDRIGTSPVATRRLNLSAPVVGGKPAQAVAHAADLFAPGHFFDRSQDEQAAAPDFEPFNCGMRIAATGAATHGDAVEAPYAWETVFPHDAAALGAPEGWDMSALRRLALSTSAVTFATRARGNPYVLPDRVPRPEAGIGVRPAGLAELRRRADLSRPAEFAAEMSSAEVQRLMRGLPEAAMGGLQRVVAGVAA